MTGENSRVELACCPFQLLHPGLNTWGFHIDLMKVGEDNPRLHGYKRKIESRNLLEADLAIGKQTFP
jgi:hypothetical protein